jgi:nucleotide-binding universal stress UspA family protein
MSIARRLTRLPHPFDPARAAEARAAIPEAEGDIARLIVEEAQARDCDLIVVGKHGLGPIEDFLLGSTTLNVLRETDRDVLVSL